MISIAQPMLTDDEKKALSDVMDSNMLVQGPQVKKFEDRFAEFCATKYGIATSSGTTALSIALMALGVKEGHEVITSPFTFIATASAIKICGAQPVFVDINPDTFNIEPDLLNDAISDKTKAILPVHLYGLSADMGKLNAVAKENGVGIVEDACQSHGAIFDGKKVGNLGDAGCFSFYPTKNMTTGEGGIITTSSDEIDKISRLIRNHGQESRYKYVRFGGNFRMTEFAGALGNIQIAKLDGFNSRRQENAAHLTEILKDTVATPVVPEGQQHVFHQYTIKLDSEDQRDNLIKHLAEKDIGSAVYYPIGLHQVEFLEGRVVGSLENTDRITKTVVSLPVHPGLSDTDVETVGREVIAALKN